MSDALLDSIARTNAIFDICSGFHIRHQSIKYDSLKKMMAIFTELEKKVADIEDEYWKGFLSFFRRYRYELATTFLPCDHPAIFNFLQYQKLVVQMKNCETVYPLFARSVKEIIELFDFLREEGMQTLYEILARVMERHKLGNAILLVRESRFVEPVAAYLKDNDLFASIAVTSPTYLDEFPIADSLIIVGAAKWYPKHVFSVPLAKQIFDIKFNWILDSLPELTVFTDLKKTHFDYLTVKEEMDYLDVGAEVTAVEDLQIDSQAVLPVLDWSMISDRSKNAQSSEADQIEINAYLLLLANGGAVFVDADAESKALAIDYSEKSNLRLAADNDGDAESFIKRICTADLKSEMFILLRTEGGGDYIVPIANSILRDKADEVNNLQKVWKTALRERVKRFGALPVSIELLDHGSQIAQELNVRNWMSEDSIRPRHDKEFLAILKCVGLGDDADKYVRAANLIDRAHRMAGFKIRKLLLNETKKIGFRNFIEKNEIVIEIPGAKAGSITAFKIMEKSPEMFKVNSDQMNQIVKLDKPIWLE